MRPGISLTMIVGLAVVGCDLPERTQPIPEPQNPIEPGAEGGPCYGNQSCNAGLICVEDQCVADSSDPDSKIQDGGNVAILSDAGEIWVRDSGTQTPPVLDASIASDTTDANALPLAQADGGVMSFDGGAAGVGIYDSGANGAIFDAGAVVPLSELDSDGDGLSDEEEIELGEDCAITNPHNADTDGDGIEDAVDGFPNDPNLEFILSANETGTINLHESNPDGTFEPAIQVGDPQYDTASAPINYEKFLSGDFDGDGRLDFMAMTEEIDNDGNKRIWHFSREEGGEDFEQRSLGLALDAKWPLAADVNGDRALDIISYTITMSGDYISSLMLKIYLNNQLPSASCFSGNESEGCFFTALPEKDLGVSIIGAYRFRFAHQVGHRNAAVDTHLDLMVTTYFSGGASDSNIYTLLGNGDGTFQDPSLEFTHAGNLSPANTLVFADLNEDGWPDVVAGLDDDGNDPGSAWLYAGELSGNFSEAPQKSVDININNSFFTDSNNPIGFATGNDLYDFSRDGHQDFVVGLRHLQASGPGEIRMYEGAGDGTFAQEYTVVGDGLSMPGTFAVPQPICVPEYEASPETLSVDGGVATFDGGETSADGGADDDVDPQIVGWREMCGNAQVCASGLLCVEGQCEEACAIEGMVTTGCDISQAEYCGRSGDESTLICTPLSGIFLELTWGGGQNNFDLYLIKNSANCSVSNACSYQTCTDGVSWSDDVADTSGNPFMLMENSCGSGPENIYLEAPAVALYSMGIHRRDNASCPNTDEGDPVEARLKLYLNGIHYNTYERDMDANLDYWELGNLHWHADGNHVVQVVSGYESNVQCMSP